MRGSISGRSWNRSPTPIREVSFDNDDTRSRGLICIARPVALQALRHQSGPERRHLRQEGASQPAPIGQASITLTIRDEGPGIPQAEIDAVFGSFVRLEQSRNRQTGGLGLGLTIARNIARAAGGEISLSNHPGGGLLTELRLPLAA